MCGMEKAATDIYTFENLRKGGYSYVDKTAILKTLADGSLGKQFFIARPRRFGKSLMISTLKALFSGRRELFEGLCIDKTDWTWEKYPIIHFEFNDLTTTSEEEFAQKASCLKGMITRIRMED